MKKDYQYKVFPSIGISRVGNSDEFYIGPETTGGLPILSDAAEKKFEPKDFRDKVGKMRRQAARFRVFKCDPDGSAIEEVTAQTNNVRRIIWTIHPANKKAVWYTFEPGNGQQGYASNHALRNQNVTDPLERQKMIIDPGPRILDGPGQTKEFDRKSDADGYQMTFPPTNLAPAQIDTLGECQTDQHGRLLFIGGYGHSGTVQSPPKTENYFNNDGWWDDTSDGPVKATIELDDGTQIPAVSAWVITAPPAYAPQVVNLVTLYDTMFDVVVREMKLRPDIFHQSVWNYDYTPDWETEVRPIFDRVSRYPYVVDIVQTLHQFDFDKLGNPDPKYNKLRQSCLSVIRPPNKQNTFEALMPRLAGDVATIDSERSEKYLKLTDTQYFMLSQWADDKFKNDKSATPDPGQVLTEATLKNCVGGAFSPGIEMTWVSRNPHIYMEPFRLRPKETLPYPLSLGTELSVGLEPGDVCKYMSLPWQTDFNECSAERIDGEQSQLVWWWPAQRPGMVYTEARPEEGSEARTMRAWVGNPDQKAEDYLMFPKDLDMVEKWAELGFVFDVGSGGQPDLIEVERNLPRNEGPSS
ncbi:MAG: LodA/GoxA family CTQ-dependent oxidase [Arenicellales bacterium]